MSTPIWKLNVEGYAGIRPREEVLVEFEKLDGSATDQVVGAYASLLVVVPEGEEPDPERALAFTGDTESSDFYFWIIKAAAYARLGQGQDVLRTLDRAQALQKRTEVDWYAQALFELMTALGHSLNGDAKRADYHIRMARTHRHSLIGGREDAWAESWLQMCFDQFEPMLGD